MKDKIIDKIIHELTPLRTLYPEIDNITNDLLIGKLDSLEMFLENEFKDVDYSKELKDLITSLVESNKLPTSYLNSIQGDIKTTKLSVIDPYNYQNAILIGFKALNVKGNNLETIKININKGISNPDITVLGNDVIHPKLIPISEYEFPEIDTQIKEETHPKLEIKDEEIEVKQETNQHPKLTPNQDIDDEVLSLEDSHIQKLRKLILNAQLNYLNNATLFIEELENKDEPELYQTLLSLNDIRYIHHSISKLSPNTLNRLLGYVSSLLQENSHNSLNIFIEEAIKKNLHDSHEKKM